MKIPKILEIEYPDSDWSLMGGGYEGLVWHDENVAKPSKEELETIWSSPEFQSQISDGEVNEDRMSKILETWPVHEQFEAITENAMGRPEKLNQLLEDINSIKNEFPK